MNPICTHIQERLIERQLTGQTGPDEAAIQAHLQTCTHCHEFQKQLDRDHDRLTEYARSVEPLVTSLQDRVAQRLGSARQRRSGLQRLYISVAAGIIIFITVWAVLYRPPAFTDEPQKIAAETAPLPLVNTTPIRLDQEQAQAKSLFAANDVNGLMNLLDTGLLPSQALVAGYLAELNASQATPALQRLAASWTGDSGANPFAQAVARLEAVPPAGRESSSLAASQPAAKSPAIPTGSGPALRFRVIDKVSGQPLAGARISDHSEKGEYVCDANGCCQIGIPATDRHRWALVVASRPGYVGTCMKFVELNEEVLSKMHVLALEPGTVIGGNVQDANGSPIQDAVISFLIRGDDGDVSETGEMTSAKPVPYIDFRQQTDTAGHWLCDTVPADLLNLAEVVGFRVAVDHNDYASQWHSVRDASTIRAMRSQTFVTTLFEGSVFRARVVNARHEPIAGARVFAGQAYITGQDGTFTLPHVHPDIRRISVSIEAPGYAKSSREIEYSPNGPDAEIMIEEGWTLHGRVVDDKGRPIENASVTIDDRSWPTDSNGDYRFEHVSTNLDRVMVSKTGFRTKSRELTGPTDQALDFVIQRGVVASGEVLDAQTGRPIERFRFMPGLVSPGGDVYFDPARKIAYTGKAGRYECPYDRLFSSTPGISYVVIVEADGYMPVVSRLISEDEGPVVIDLAMTPGTGPAGVVLDANGLPAADALVYASPENNGDKPTYDGTALFGLYENSRTRTDADGRFSFEPMLRIGNLVAMTEQGIAGMPVSELSQTGRLVIQPWAEVQGVLRCGKALMSGITVKIRSLSEAATQCGYKWELSARTDPQGVFQIKRVPPGEFTLMDKTYQVSPGQVLSLDLTVDPNAP